VVPPLLLATGEDVVRVAWADARPVLLSLTRCNPLPPPYRPPAPPIAAAPAALRCVAGTSASLQRGMENNRRNEKQHDTDSSSEAAGERVGGGIRAGCLRWLVLFDAVAMANSPNRVCWAF